MAMRTDFKHFPFHQKTVKVRHLQANSSMDLLSLTHDDLADKLEALGQPTDWIDAAVGQVVPEYAQAAKQLKTAKQAVTIAERNANSLRKSFAEGRSMSIITDGRNYDPDR